MKYTLTESAQKTHKKRDDETLYHRGCSFDLIYQSLISEKLSPAILKSTPWNIPPNIYNSKMLILSINSMKVN